MEIAGRAIGEAEPPFIIAEVSGNHGGKIERALEIIDAAADAGAECVKFQTYTADTITIESDLPAFRLDAEHDLWGGRSLYDLYTEAHTPWEWHEELFGHARKRGLIPFSSPFDPTAVDLLESLGAPAYKIASLEVGDTGLLDRVAATGKPVIISNGASTFVEIAEAVERLRASGCTQIAVLSCTSAYPADPKEANVRSIPVLRDALDVTVGFSDHTPGLGASLAAVSWGATIIEKHLTISREDGSVDSKFSLEPHQLGDLVVEARTAWEALGSRTPVTTPSEAQSRRLRRSLWVVTDVQAGDELTEVNVRSIRPGGGLDPRELSHLVGRRFNADVKSGTPLTWDLV